MELEIKALLSDIDRIANATQFNGISLLNSNVPSSFFIEVGPNASQAVDAVNIASGLIDSRVDQLSVIDAGGGTNAGFISISAIQLTNNSIARLFLRDVDNALNRVSRTRAIIGSFQNRFTSTIENLQSQFENFSSAESRIRDLDVASETAELTRAQILQQATLSVLSQANQAPSLALGLISGK
jgi:flagellin